MAREMKHSGIKWIGDIPVGWNVHPLKLYFNERNHPNSLNQENNLLSLSYGKVIRKNINSVGGLLPASYSTYNIIEPNDIVIRPTDLQNDHKSLRTGLCREHGIVTSAYITIKPIREMSPAYFHYLLHSYDIAKVFYNMGSGVRQGLNFDEFSKLLLLEPPFNEQQAIADFLDTKCAEIDGLLGDLDKEVKTLTEYKKSIISETVTRGLNHSVPMKQSGIPWVQEIPEHWKVMANKYLMYKVKEIVPIYGGQDIISLSMNGVIVRDLDAGGKMPTSFNGYQHITVGNLLMCLFDIDVTPRCIGLIKNDGLTSPAYSQFAMKAEAYAPYYYYFYLKMDNTKELVHLSKNMRHSLNEEQFGMIPTIVPPMDEQIAISKYLDEKIANIDKAISDKLLQIDKLKEYKASLIYEYVTGKKQVI
ncbi:MAG: restriction endonuclease subunit S [Bacteroidales bacterium]|nr:restriction endonuclease subunit S [Bacteroidales bacterium]